MASDSYAYQRYYSGQTAVEKPMSEPKTKKKQKVKIKAGVKVWNRVVFCIGFLLFFCIVFRYTIINEMTATTTAMEKQLQDMTAATEQAAIYLDKTTDLKNVEETARNELHMDFPQSHQIVNVTLKHEDKVVKTAPLKQGFFEKAKNVVKKTLEYLY